MDSLTNAVFMSATLFDFRINALLSFILVATLSDSMTRVLSLFSMLFVELYDSYPFLSFTLVTTPLNSTVRERIRRFIGIEVLLFSSESWKKSYYA